MRAAVALVLLTSACAAPPRATAARVASATPAPSLAAATRAEVVLPSDWATMPARAFEKFALQSFPGDVATPLSSASTAALALAMRTQDGAAVRAAVLLARCATPAARDALLARLEERQAAPDDAADAGDVVAAAGLASFALDEEHLARVVDLVVGDRPHPDVETRVELAGVALAGERIEVVPFLLAVLREGTPSGLALTPDWPRQPRMAWPRSRAAEALAAWLGEAARFDPDGALADQEREIERLTARARERTGR